MMNRRIRSSILTLGWVAACVCSMSRVHATDLMDVYHDALANDPTFQAASATLMASREARPQAWAALLPQISGSAGRTRDHSSGYQSNVTLSASGSLFPFSYQNTGRATNDQWSLNLSQAVFSWTDWMNVRAAEREVAEAQATYQAATEDLIVRTAAAYFDVLSAVDTLKEQQSSLEAFSDQLMQADARYRVGTIGITDVEQARAARDTAASAVITAKEALASAVNGLRAITGRQYDVLSKPADDMPLALPQPADPEQWVQTAVQGNFALIASRLAADVARERVRVAFGGHLPSVTLVASRSYARSQLGEDVFGQSLDLPSKTNDRQIGLEVSVPIFSGGATQSGVHQAQYQWIAAKDEMRGVARSTEEQTRDAYLGVISGIANIRQLRHAVTSSETAYQATEDGYRAGTQSEVDVLNALNALVLAKTQYATTRYAYINSVIQLRGAAGMLDVRVVSAVDRWLTTSISVSGRDLRLRSSVDLPGTVPEPPGVGVTGELPKR